MYKVLHGVYMVVYWFSGVLYGLYNVLYRLKFYIHTRKHTHTHPHTHTVFARSWGHVPFVFVDLPGSSTPGSIAYEPLGRGGGEAIIKPH